MKAVIFDLDGVIVDTAKYHFFAWKRLTQSLGFEIDLEINERLKGVSRMDSLEVVLEVGNMINLTLEQKNQLATDKNNIYLDMISELNESDILPGIAKFLGRLKVKGYKIALGSASKSGRMIIDKLKLNELFDVIVDGNLVSKAKPDSEVFTKAAELLDVPCNQCIVVEDAVAGVEAAKNGGMYCIAIGREDVVKEADIVIDNTELLNKIKLEDIFN